jgi:chemotaxis protein CheD
MNPVAEAIPKHFLYPCRIFVHQEAYYVHTLLGSCVSVCLCDQKRACGGMNHYMLPLWNGEGLATPKYGNIAIENLVERMLSLGCNKKDLVAKVFGGANVTWIDSGPYNVGERNIIVANERLGHHKIPIIAMETGGDRGFKVIFHTRKGLVYVKRLTRNGSGQPPLPDGRPPLIPEP